MHKKSKPTPAILLAKAIVDSGLQKKQLLKKLS